MHTPVSIYLKVRDMYPQSALMESSDYHAGENSLSFIALCPLASIVLLIMTFFHRDVLEVLHGIKRRISVKSAHILIISGHLKLIDKPVHSLFYIECFCQRFFRTALFKKLESASVKIKHLLHSIVACSCNDIQLLFFCQ